MGEYLKGQYEKSSILNRCKYLITRYVMVMRTIESYQRELLSIEKEFQDVLKGLKDED